MQYTGCKTDVSQNGIVTKKNKNMLLFFFWTRTVQTLQLHGNDSAVHFFGGIKYVGYKMSAGLRGLRSHQAASTIFKFL